MYRFTRTEKLKKKIAYFAELSDYLNSDVRNKNVKNSHTKKRLFVQRQKKVIFLNVYDNRKCLSSSSRVTQENQIVYMLIWRAYVCYAGLWMCVFVCVFVSSASIGKKFHYDFAPSSHTLHISSEFWHIFCQLVMRKMKKNVFRKKFYSIKQQNKNTCRLFHHHMKYKVLECSTWVFIRPWNRMKYLNFWQLSNTMCAWKVL